MSKDRWNISFNTLKIPVIMLRGRFPAWEQSWWVIGPFAWPR